ncbi:hypothetical protein [Streptomyces sp. CC219B]|uniref:hypothetical protein n=1 Tax=Streptomyces sp. CC219B TaxID=3044574 RepID=UPI0024A9D9A0|nr:hypothetical protein [Streptomyces sp. CC219B]
MRRWRQLVIDTWGALSYKPAFQAAAEGRPTQLPGPTAASWLPESEHRRLAACTVLAAYDHNQAAALLGKDGDDRREYGDASLIVDQTLSHLLGETQQIVVKGVEEDRPGGLAEIQQPAPGVRRVHRSGKRRENARRRPPGVQSRGPRQRDRRLGQ